MIDYPKWKILWEKIPELKPPHLHYDGIWHIPDDPIPSKRQTTTIIDEDHASIFIREAALMYLASRQMLWCFSMTMDNQYSVQWHHNNNKCRYDKTVVHPDPTEALRIAISQLHSIPFT